MAKQHNSILILGEGPTEFYYFHSLRDELRSINIKPDYLKHTSMKELELKIEEGITLNYSHIFCVIDMDNKDEISERQQYEKLKRTYAKPVNKPKKGIHCEVRFYETHRYRAVLHLLFQVHLTCLCRPAVTPQRLEQYLPIREDRSLLSKEQRPPWLL